MTAVARPTALLVLAHGLGALSAGLNAVLFISGLVQGQSAIEALPFLLLLVVTLAVGWLLAARQPRNPVGWILLAIPVLFTLGEPLGALQVALQDSAPGVARWITWYNGTDDDPSWSWVPPVWLLLAQLPLRFPTGRLPSPRWRWVSRVSVVALVVAVVYLGTVNPRIGGRTRNPAFVPAMHSAEAILFPVVFVLLATVFVLCIASLVVRYRGSEARERAQLRWMLWAVSLAVVGLATGAIVPDSLAWVQTWVLLLYALIPIAVAVAVLRYRLYEIDRIISRTAAYAVVTMLTIGTYFGVILLISLLLPGDREGIHQTPPIVVALATLAAAAVFLPALRWVRRVIDRVFNRSQYDAERVVVAFGERIRNGANPDTAGSDLLGAVGQTLQPSAIGLWVQKQSR